MKVYKYLFEVFCIGFEDDKRQLEVTSPNLANAKRKIKAMYPVTINSDLKIKLIKKENILL